MITSSSFVFGNSNKRFTILNIYDEEIIKPAMPIDIINITEPSIIKQEAFEVNNKCCIIS
jgi:hypothetical protein